MQVRPAPTVRSSPAPSPNSSLLGPAARDLPSSFQPGKLDLRPRPGGRISINPISQLKGKYIGDLTRGRGTGVMGRSPFLSLECGGGVRAALRQVRVSRVSGLVPENGIAKGNNDDVEVLGIEE